MDKILTCGDLCGSNGAICTSGKPAKIAKQHSFNTKYTETKSKSWCCVIALCSVHQRKIRYFGHSNECIEYGNWFVCKGSYLFWRIRDVEKSTVDAIGTDVLASFTLFSRCHWLNGLKKWLKLILFTYFIAHCAHEITQKLCKKLSCLPQFSIYIVIK